MMMMMMMMMIWGVQGAAAEYVIIPPAGYFPLSPAQVTFAVRSSLLSRSRRSPPLQPVTLRVTLPPPAPFPLSPVNLHYSPPPIRPPRCRRCPHGSPLLPRPLHLPPLPPPAAVALTLVGLIRPAGGRGLGPSPGPDGPWSGLVFQGRYRRLAHSTIDHTRALFIMDLTESVLELRSNE